MTKSEHPSAYIDSYIPSKRRNYSDSHAGVIADPTRRLFKNHKTDEDDGYLNHKQVRSSDQARLNEKRLLEMGCNGESEAQRTQPTSMCIGSLRTLRNRSEP